MDVINELILQAVASPWIPLVLFAVAVIDGFFPPVPSETLLVAAVAVAASSGSQQLILLCALAAAGAIIGDNIAYWIGQGVGIRRFGWMRRPRAAAAFERARARMRGPGATALIFGARYIPVGRVAVNMSAGALGVPWRRFLLLSTFAGITWAIYGTALGALAGSWFAEQPLLSAVLAVAVASGLALLAERFTRRRRRRPSPSDAARPLDTASSRTDLATVAG